MPNEKDIERGAGEHPPAHTVGTPTLPDHEKPKGFAFVMILVSLLASLFLVALDRTILATAVPAITNEFHSLGDVTWYAGAYLITACATQVIWGRVYKFYDAKYVLLSSIVLFEVGSTICAAAPNSVALIIGRAVAGAGSAAIQSGTVNVIVNLIPLAKRPAYMGLVGMIFAVSSVAGPLLGGSFATGATWRWCFWINLPIGGVAWTFMFFFLKAPRRSEHESASLKEQILRLDPLGSLFFLPSIICLLLALQWGGTRYAWNNGRIIALFVLAGLLQIVFWAVQVWQGESATVQMRIIKQRSVAAGIAYSMCVGGSLVTMLYWLAIWFQAVKGVSAVRSGIDTVPLVLSLAVAAMVSGIVVRKVGYYNPAMYLAVVLLAVSAGLFTTFNPGTSKGEWIGFQVLFGLGLGTGMQQASLSTQNSLGPADVSIGIALMFLGQNLGGAVFNAIAQVFFNDRLSTGLSSIAGIDAGTVISLGATELRSRVSGEALIQVVAVYNDALRNVFYVVTAAASLLVVPVLLIEIKKLPSGPPGGGPAGKGESSGQVPPTEGTLAGTPVNEGPPKHSA